MVTVAVSLLAIVMIMKVTDSMETISFVRFALAIVAMLIVAKVTVSIASGCYGYCCHVYGGISNGC